jgi:hypothetical protein
VWLNRAGFSNALWSCPVVPAGSASIWSSAESLGKAGAAPVALLYPESYWALD